VTRSWSVLRRVLALSAPPWGRLAVAGLLGFAGAAATLWLLAGSGYVVARAAARPGLGAIAGVLALVEVAAFVRAPLRYGERLVAHEAAFRALAGWRVWLYDRLEPLAPAGLAGWRSGDVLRHFVDDVDALQDLYLRGAVPIVVAVLAGGLSLAVVGVLLPVAAIPLAVGLALALVAAPLLALTTHHLAARESAARAEQLAATVELFQGTADLVAFGYADTVLARLDLLEDRLRRAQRRRAVIGGAGGAVLTFAVGVAVVGTLVAAVDAVHGHHLNPVLVAVIPLAALAAFDTIPPVMTAALHLGDVVAAGRRVLQLGAVPPPVTDPAEPAAPPTGPVGVTFEDARLRYGDTRPWALDGVDFAVPPGTSAAVIGPSGAGKSSLVNVLARFWPLTAGRARIGGADLATLTQRDARHLLGLVDQGAHLFTGTIRHNLTLGRSDIDDDALSSAVARAQLDPWVEGLASGLDTPVGEHGAQVSAGQRRRIVLARALLSGGPVLVLDEPTAELDPDTAARLLRDVLGSRAPGAGASAGTSPRGRPTIVLVTHRAADLAGVDQVVELARGRVVQVRR
jgi:thiol reductant ABC exporter CydC subunit